MATKSDVYKELRAALNEVRLVDTHEHLTPEEERVKQSTDLFHTLFSHYASSDLVSAGFPEARLAFLRDTSQPLDRRWKEFAPYWERMRHTAYARSLLIALRGLFGIDDLNAKTYLAASEQIVSANRKGWYKTVLRDKAGIEVSLLDLGTAKVDRTLFRPVIRMDAFLTPLSLEDIRKVENEFKASVHSVGDLVRAMEGAAEGYIKRGIVGFKIGHAYERPIRYDKVTLDEAERAFNRLCPSASESFPDTRVSRATAKPLQDYMVHRLVQFAGEHDVPVQIHTGIQEGTGNFVANTNPSLLTNLFFEYRRTRFDLFHGSYPYSREAGILAKNFQNVAVDLCWFHIISPSAARAMLHEWIETVPLGKIFGFGGDYCFVEGVYGHAVMARDNVARVLAEKVEEGYLTEKEALTAGRRLLHDNAAEFFRVGK